MLEISSPNNPKIKLIKSLYRKRERWKNKLFLIEGIRLVEEGIDNAYPIRDIIYTDELFNTQGGPEIFEKIQDHKNLIYMPFNLFKEISDTENPQGIMAVADFPSRSMEESFKSEDPLILILDEIQDPGNMGTIIRTADAFNIDGLIISEGSVDIYNPKVVRSTMGSIFRLPIYYVEDMLATVEDLKSKGFEIYTSSLGDTNYIYDVDFKGAKGIIIGNEARGVSEELYRLANGRVKIPILGQAESLNAAIASSIIMYEAIRQRRG